MKRSLFMTALSLLLVSPNASAQNPGKATGAMVIGKHNVMFKHAYLISVEGGFNKGRSLILSANDLSATIQKCKTMMCITGSLKEGLELQLDSDDGRLNLWAVANGQKVQHSYSLDRSTMEATTDKADAVAGAFAMDKSGIGGPKIEVEFETSLTKSVKE